MTAEELVGRNNHTIFGLSTVCVRAGLLGPCREDLADGRLLLRKGWMPQKKPVGYGYDNLSKAQMLPLQFLWLSSAIFTRRLTLYSMRY